MTVASARRAVATWSGACLLLLAATAHAQEVAPEPPAEEPVVETAEAPEAAALIPWMDPASDAEELRPLVPVEGAGMLTAQVGNGRLLSFDTEVERMALGDPTIARVQVITAREALITGLEPGRTTLVVWLRDGRRLQYTVQIEWDLQLLEKAVKDLDPRIIVEVSSNGRSIVLRGEVADREAARRARLRAESLVAGMVSGQAGARVIELLRYPGAIFSVEDELRALLATVDPRIRVNRIQVGEEPSIERDTFLLEGQVKDTRSLQRAVILAERQLGGTGTQVSAGFEDDRVASRRSRSFGGAGFVGQGGGAGTAGIASSDPRSSSLAAQVARGLLLTSASGRVVSLLSVDEIYQIMVSTRFLEIDRTKARQAGISFRVDAEHVSIGSYNSPAVGSLPAGSDPPTVSGLSSDLGNVVGAFVDQTSAVVAAFDFLQANNLARSVAEPNVLTLSGELASVSVGGEVPIPIAAGTQAATFQGVGFQEFGVSLEIRPTVTDDRMVLLEVAPSIVRALPGAGGVPSFTVQRVTTTARVQAGQSLLIGGLLSFEEGLESRGVPGLSKIPLFGWKRRTRQERELLFLITPRLVRIEPEERAGAVVDPTVDPGEIELPELDWPEGREGWRDLEEPPPLPPDGIPESFRQEPGDEGKTSASPVEEEVGAMAPPASDPGPVAVEPDVEPTGTTTEGALEPDSLEVRQVVSKSSRCVNFRAEAGMWSRPLDCVAVGTLVELLAGTDSWRLVRLADGREGWMAGHCLAPPHPESGHSPEDGASEATLDYEVTEAVEPGSWQVGPVDPCINFRPWPSLDSPPHDCIAPLTPIELLAAHEGWRLVRLPDGREGWMVRLLLIPSPASP
jgi:Flp pilus assembly secretin CpaC/SH3-like domain-containing protein